MAHKATAAIQNTKELRQKKLIQELRKKENWMKWGLIAAGIIILLLLLFIGYITDWTVGLQKDKSATPISTELDSSKQPTGTTGTSGTGSTGTSASQGSTSNTGTSSNGSNTASETSRSNTSTTNNTTNTTTTTPPPSPPSAPNNLLSLYADSNAGDTLTDVINRANTLGVSVACGTGLLVKECTFSSDGYSITTKSLLDTNLITSVLKNF